MNEEVVKRVVKQITAKFRTFGGGEVIDGNPISIALKDSPSQFAGGVIVEDVVRFVLEAVKEK